MNGQRHGNTRFTAGILIGICLLTASAPADVAIKPAFVEVNLSEGRPAGSFLISNVGDKEERYRVNAIHFTYTEQGALQRTETGDYSLAAWIRFNPRELTLPPNTQRAVRFAIIPRGQLPEGEYWAAMELESLAVSEVTSKDDKTGRSMKLRMIATILAPIFGTVGKPSYTGEVQDLQVAVEKDAVLLKARVAATGTGRLGMVGDYEIADTSGHVVDSGPFCATYVLRGGQRWVTKQIKAAIPPGEYTVRLKLRAAHLTQPITAEAQVKWPQVPPAEAAAPAAAVTAEQPASSTDGGSTSPDAGTRPK